MKKIFISIILMAILTLPTYSACKVTGGACAINDIISEKTENNKTEKKNKINTKINKKEQKKNTAKKLPYSFKIK